MLTSVQSAVALVHSYPFIMQPEPLLRALAQQHNQTSTSQPFSDVHMPEVDTNWALLAAYVIQVCAQDHFEYVPLLGFDPSQDLLSSEMAASPQGGSSSRPLAQAGVGCMPPSAAPSCQSLSMPAVHYQTGQSTPESCGPADLMHHLDDVSKAPMNLMDSAHDCSEQDGENAFWSNSFLFDAPSLSQILQQGEGPDARRGFDHEVLQGWQGPQGRSDQEVIQTALGSTPSMY